MRRNKHAQIKMELARVIMINYSHHRGKGEKGKVRNYKRKELHRSERTGRARKSEKL